MLVVSSAGNEGNDAWLHITAPADADSILSIGAVNSNEVIASFSGRGNASDGRIKPDVSAMGVNTVAQAYPGSLTLCNGTSCSSPIITGMAACLWQSRPNVTAQSLRLAILEASDRYQWPDSLYGYGIPDFYTAQEILDSISPTADNLSSIALTPNVIEDYAQVSTTLPWLSSSATGVIAVYDLNGRLLQTRTVQFSPGITITVLNNLQVLEPGYYVLRIVVENRFYNVPFIKK
jgi:subtilisin family serine protease